MLTKLYSYAKCGLKIKKPDVCLNSNLFYLQPSHTAADKYRSSPD